MRAIIADAGIGGLTTALALHRAGIEADVFEQVSEVRGPGVGISMLPHAVKKLVELGLLPALDRVGVRGWRQPRAAWWARAQKRLLPASESAAVSPLMSRIQRALTDCCELNSERSQTRILGGVLSESASHASASTLAPKPPAVKMGNGAESDDNDRGQPCQARVAAITRAASASGDRTVASPAMSPCPPSPYRATRGESLARQPAAARCPEALRRPRGRGLSTATVLKVHTVMHGALRQAVKWGLVGRNVAEAVESPRPVETEKRALTPEQTKSLLAAAAGDRLEALYWMAIGTGLRQGELFALRWSDIDLKAGTLQVQRKVRRVGKLGLQEGQPKSRNASSAPRPPADRSGHAWGVWEPVQARLLHSRWPPDRRKCLLEVVLVSAAQAG